MPKKIIITGFEPFDGEPVNAAWEVVKSFDGQHNNDYVVEVHQLPTVFGKAIGRLKEVVSNGHADYVICVGQAGGRSAISFERIGVNMDDARIPDNDGNQPLEQQIVGDGPSAYWSTLPVRHLVTGLQELGIPAEESLSAGTYVCNHVLYGLMHLLAEPQHRQRGTKGGFIHIPYLPSQAVRHKNAPCLSIDEVRRGLQWVVETLAGMRLSHE